MFHRDFYGLDEIRYAAREGWTAENGRVFLPGGVLILRRGNAVLFADYYGEQNLLDYLPRLHRCWRACRKETP